MKKNIKYLKPVMVDNKNLRKKYSVINKYFSSSLDESNWFPKINNVVKSKKIVDLYFFLIFVNNFFPKVDLPVLDIPVIQITINFLNLIN